MVQRRKRFAALIRAVAPSPDVSFSSNIFQAFVELHQSIDGWMSDFWNALNGAAEDFASIERQTLILIDSIEAFKKIEPLRPWRALHSFHAEFLASLRGVFDYSIVIYAAETPIEAQIVQRKMQDCADAAAEAISNWAEAVSKLEGLIGRSPEDQFIAATAAGFQGGSDSATFVNRLLIGLNLPVHPFPGVNNFMVSCVELCTMLGERQAFADTVSTILGVLRTDPPKVAEILGSHHFSENFGRSLEETHRSGTMLHLVAVLSGNEKLAVDAVVDVAHSLVESSTRQPLALAAAALGDRGYKRWIEKGANECVRYLKQQGYGQLVSDLNLDLRNAKSHRSYRLTQDGGIDILNDRGNLQCHLNVEHIVDAVVAGHVLFMGLALGVVLFACETHIDITKLLANVDEMPPAYSVKCAALVHGWPLPEVRAAESCVDTLIISPCPPVVINAENRDMETLNVVITMARRLSKEAAFVQFDDGGDDPLTIEVRRANDFIDNEAPEEAAVLFIKFVHSLRRGESRAISDDEWRNLLLVHAARAAESMDGDAVRRLKKLQSVVRECGDDEFAEQLNIHMSNVRRAIAGKRSAGERIDLLELPSSRPPTWITRNNRR